jgi:hypothetical protein
MFLPAELPGPGSRRACPAGDGDHSFNRAGSRRQIFRGAEGVVEVEQVETLHTQLPVSRRPPSREWIAETESLPGFVMK